MTTNTNPPKKCPCGAPVAAWTECPVANKAGMCKPCFELYLSLGVVEQVKSCL